MNDALKKSSPAACNYFFGLTFILAVAFMGGSTIGAAENGSAFDMINQARNIARTGNYAEALNKLQEAISLANQNDEKMAMAIAYNNLAEIYRLQGNKIEALESYAQALQIYHEMGHRKGIASTGQKIDAILGRKTMVEPPEQTAAAEPPAPLDAPQVAQPPLPNPATETTEQSEVTLLTPQEVEPLAPPAPESPESPPEAAPPPSREKLIEEAIKRVRNRVRERQSNQAPGESAPPEVPLAQPTPPSEAPQQSAHLRTPPITKPTDYSSYLEGVKKSIVQAWQYPEQASERGLEGKVDVEFTILRDGRLLDVRILDSSGYPALDREAIRAVGAASPFSPIPKQVNLEQLSIRFTFNYTLENRQSSR